MSLRRYALLVIGFLMLPLAPGLPPRPSGSPPPPDEAPPGKLPPYTNKDVQQLKQAVRTRNGEAILAFFRGRTLGEQERDQIARLLRRFGDRSFAVREKAVQDLASRGSRSAALVRQALDHPDPEIAVRASRCLELSLEGSQPNLQIEAMRLLGKLQPDRTAEILLSFVPYAQDESLAWEAITTLSRVAIREGEPHEVVLRALTDPEPLRRTAAGIALCQRGGEKHRHDVHKLLQDGQVLVRFRVGRALLRARDPEAIPALISLFEYLPEERLWWIVDVLSNLAGSEAPAIPFTGPGVADPQRARQSCRLAWSEWWRRYRDKIDLARRDLEGDGLQGLTLVVEMDLNSLMGQIVELDSQNVTHWTIDRLHYPIAAQFLDNNSVLIAEYKQQRVSEQNFQGVVQWSVSIDKPPIAAQRLANGHTFVLCRSQLLEFDGAGREIFRRQWGRRDIVAGRKLKDGQIVLLTQDGSCRFFDSQGKEERHFVSGSPQVLGSGIDILPNKRIVVPLIEQNKVVEYNANGEILWQVAVARPTCVFRLPNGHTLAGSTVTRQIVELNREGQVIWKTLADACPIQISRR